MLPAYVVLRTPRLTDQERRSIVDEAIRLIQQPINFVQGWWKCPLWVNPADPNEIVAINDSSEGGQYVPESYVRACDENGREMFSYCVEGAINQAGINILGRERAGELGAWDGSKEWGEPEPSHNPVFSDYLSVNDMARVFISQKGLYDGPLDNIESPARYVNDLEDFEQPDRSKDRAHRRVLKILRDRAEQLTS